MALRRGFMLGLIALCLTSPAWSGPGDTPAETPLRLARTVVNTGGESAEACLRFNRPMDDRVEAHYGDYVSVSPSDAAPSATAPSPVVRGRGKDVCIAGLGFGQAYDIAVRKGLAARDGTRLAADARVTVRLGDRNPSVNIGGAGFILPRGDAPGLTIETVNVDRVRVHVLRMGATMLASKPGQPASPERTLAPYEINALLADSANLVWSGEMEVKRVPNHTARTAFPVGDVVRDKGIGAFLVVAEDAATPPAGKLFDGPDANGEDEGPVFWTRQFAAHWVMVTDLAVTTIQGGDGLHAFVRSLRDGQPVRGAALSLVAVGQDTLASATTDADGAALFAPGLLRGKGSLAARSLTARAGGDFTIQDLQRPAFDLSDRGVDGMAPLAAQNAFVATERGVYRPGETVNVVALLRGHDGAALDAPVTLTLRRPDGVAAERADEAHAQAGGFVRGFALSPTAARGKWSVEARVDPSGAPVGRAEFSVEDFVPRQLHVDVTDLPPALIPGQALRLTVKGRFLYGAPAAGLNGEASVRFARDEAPVAGADGYSFGPAEATVDGADQTLAVPDADATGTSQVSAAVTLPDAPGVPLKAIVSAGLFEPGGRLVAPETTLPVRNLPMLIGVRALVPSTNTFANDARQVRFDVLGFDREGKPAAAALRWTVIRENIEFDRIETEGRTIFHQHKVDEPVRNGTVDVRPGAPSTITESLPWGQYRFVVADAAGDATSSVAFGVGYFTPENEADTPDKAEVTAEAGSVAPGATARVHVRAPFAGPAEIVVANDRVIETRRIDVPRDGATVEVKAGDGWGAGAYVTATVYRPLSEKARPRDPVRAIGLAYVAVDQSARTLAVTIGAAEKVAPRQRVEVPVHVAGGGGQGGPVFVTLAAVDEGILQLTRFASPDPAGYLFAKRRLGVDLRDDYGRLLRDDAPAGAIREGGDESLGGAGLAVTSTRIVSLFAGPARVDANGDARVPLDLPDFQGQVRLMALAWSAGGVGGASAPMTVRDPAFVDLSLPRFLAPGDHARVPLSLVDADAPAGAYGATVTASGAAHVEDAAPMQAALKPGDRKPFAFTLVGDAAGVATVRAELTGPGGMRQAREWPIAVRGAHFPVTLAQTAAQAPGETFRLDPKQADGYVPGTLKVTVGYGGFAGLDPSSILQSLDAYPYGCTEQLASEALALIWFNDPALLGRVPGDGAAKRKVDGAIRAILDREDPAGAFGLWRVGDGAAPDWLQVYATDFLLHAREAGFAVPDDAFARALDTVAGKVVGEGDDGDGPQGRVVYETRAYALYVLARAGRPDAAAARMLADGITTVPPAKGRPELVGWTETRPAGALALGHLAGTLWLLHDEARARPVFAEAVRTLEALRRPPPGWATWTYWSYVRDLAGLTALAAESGQTEIAQALVTQFGKLNLSPVSLSTQEAASLLSAAHAMNRDDPARALTVGGAEIRPLKLPAAFSPDLKQIGAGFTARNDGETALWRTLTVSGVPREAPPALAAGYTLRRRTLTLDGKPFDAAHARQNDRFIVVLDGQANDKAEHRTVAVDMLPAGWEIEAPVKDATRFGFLGPLSEARVAEARDDRFVAAVDLGAGLRGFGRFVTTQDDDKAPTLGDAEFRVAYLARVTVAGGFAWPEAVVSDMYRPALMARTEAGRTDAAAR